MEETILVGDDLMMGPPSPIIPPEIASHVLEGVELCDGLLRNLFLCKFYIPLILYYIFVLHLFHVAEVIYVAIKCICKVT